MAGLASYVIYILLSILVHQATPFFTSLAQQGLLSYPVFAVHLTRNDTGTLSLGKLLICVLSWQYYLTVLVSCARCNRFHGHAVYWQL
jgi:hypothetical protein